MNYVRTSFWSPTGSGRELKTKIHQLLGSCFVPNLSSCVRNLNSETTLGHRITTQLNGSKIMNAIHTVMYSIKSMSIINQHEITVDTHNDIIFTYCIYPISQIGISGCCVCQTFASFVILRCPNVCTYLAIGKCVHQEYLHHIYIYAHHIHIYSPHMFIHHIYLYIHHMYILHMYV